MPRQIHSVCGLLLIGFLMVHLAICLTGFEPTLYRSTVAQVESMVAATHGLVLLLIFLPLAAQMGSGFFLLQHHGLRYNVKKCNRGGKLRFFLQRVTAVVLALFVVVHVATLHHWGFHALYRITHSSLLSRYAHGGLFDPAGDAYQSTVVGLTQAWSPASALAPGNLVLTILTLLGVLAAAYHAGNGFWSGGLVLKLATKEKRRTMLAVASLAVGLLVGASGLAACCAFVLAALSK